MKTLGLSKFIRFFLLVSIIILDYSDGYTQRKETAQEFYDRKYGDEPDHWDNVEFTPKYLVGDWYQFDGYSKLTFHEDGKLTFYDRLGEVHSSNWSATPYLDDKNKKQYKINIYCCYDVTEFTTDNPDPKNYLSISYMNEKYSSLKIIKWVDESKGNLTKYQFERLKSYFIGKWKYKKGGGFLSYYVGLNLKVDGTFETVTSLGKNTSPPIGQSGTWHIYYEDREGKKNVYLNLIRKGNKSSQNQISRYAINLENLTESGFVPWRIDSTLEGPYEYTRIKSFREVTSEVNEEGLVVLFLGAITAKAIINGMSEEAAVRQYDSKDYNTERLMKIWKEQEAREKGY